MRRRQGGYISTSSSQGAQVDLSTHHVFDEMHEIVADSGDDRFGILPDELLWRVITFLSADEALQTCVLDTRWRDLWRRATNLLFIFDERSKFLSCKRFEQLAKLVIHLRGNSPLVKCEINAYHDGVPDESFRNTKLLIDYALACQVEEITINSQDNQPMFSMPLSLISKHLKAIHFERVNLEQPTLNFSECPILEDLTIHLCGIYARKISSKSLKRLCITHSCSLPDVRIRICSPGLISLQLDVFDGLTPFLEEMPLLETANIRLDVACDDFWHINKEYCSDPYCRCQPYPYCRGNCGDPACYFSDYPMKEGVLLNGLSNVVELELISLPEVYIYRWDLKWCPIFSKLKTLLINEWFTPINLVCILQHSPILEILTLQLYNTKNITGAPGIQETVEQSHVCGCLKYVNIECEEVDEGVREILNILSTCGIRREKICIKDRTQIVFSTHRD